MLDSGTNLFTRSYVSHPTTKFGFQKFLRYWKDIPKFIFWIDTLCFVKVKPNVLVMLKVLLRHEIYWFHPRKEVGLRALKLGNIIGERGDVDAVQGHWDTEMCWSRGYNGKSCSRSRRKQHFSLSGNFMVTFLSSLLSAWQVWRHKAMMSLVDSNLRFHCLISSCDAWNCEGTTVRIRKKSKRNGEGDGDDCAENCEWTFWETPILFLSFVSWQRIHFAMSLRRRKQIVESLEHISSIAGRN